MIKRLLIALLAFVSCLGLNAQTNPPDAFVYQGLAKNPGTGGIATNTKVRLKVQVLQGGPKGPMVFEEHHNTTTNADGIFSVLVGRGTKLSVTTYSSLYDIPWSQDSFYFSLSMSIAMRFPPNSYSPYLPIGTQQFFSVPYAMFAKEAQSVLDTLSIAAGGNYRFLQLGSQKPVVFYVGDGDTSALNELQELVRLGGRMGLKTTSGEIVYSVTLPDSSATNELQTLTQSGNIITLSQGGGSVTIVDKDNQTLAISGQTLMINGGNSVTLPDKDQQTLSLSGNSLSISNGNSVTINPNDADADPNNEIQTISKSGSTITLNKSGGSISDSDNQNLSVSGSSLTISSGNSVTLPDGSSTNELQTLGQTSGKGTITLSQGGGLVTLPDSSASNEIQNLSLSGASLSISSGNSVTLPDASSSNELQTLSKSGSTISLSNSGGSVTDSDNQNLSLSGASLSISSGNSVTLPDASSTNEIQTLSISGNTISLSQSGGSVTVPDSDDQTLSISGSTLSISNGNSVTINTNDSDADPSNEIQTISKSGSTITLSQNGGSVTDSDGQTLNLNGNTLSISGGNSVTLNPNDADADASNEIQTLSISGNTISLSQSGGSVTVPDSDDQTLSISGNTLSISGGNSVTVNPNDADADSTNEIQTLTLSGNTLSISGGNSVTLTTTDSDADSTNEIQTLSKIGNKISLSRNGGEVVDSDSQVISYSKGTVTLERGGSFNLPDTSSSNELQTLSLSGDTLKISNGNSVILASTGYPANLTFDSFIQIKSKVITSLKRKASGYTVPYYLDYVNSIFIDIDSIVVPQGKYWKVEFVDFVQSEFNLKYSGCSSYGCMNTASPNFYDKNRWRINGKTMSDLTSGNYTLWLNPGDVIEIIADATSLDWSAVDTTSNHRYISYSGNPSIDYMFSILEFSQLKNKSNTNVSIQQYHSDELNSTNFSAGDLYYNLDELALYTVIPTKVGLGFDTLTYFSGGTSSTSSIIFYRMGGDTLIISIFPKKELYITAIDFQYEYNKIGPFSSSQELTLNTFIDSDSIFKNGCTSYGKTATWYSSSSFMSNYRRLSDFNNRFEPNKWYHFVFTMPSTNSSSISLIKSVGKSTYINSAKYFQSTSYLFNGSPCKLGVMFTLSEYNYNKFGHLKVGP